MNRSDDPEDHAFISHFRNKVSYTNYRNSLIEWTLSEAWTKLGPSCTRFRGEKSRTGSPEWALAGNSFTGEIPWRDMEAK